MSAKPRAGEEFVVLTFGNAVITVNRVAKSGAWADITVEQGGAKWGKRQPLVNGWFPFEVAELTR